MTLLERALLDSSRHGWLVALALAAKGVDLAYPARTLAVHGEPAPLARS